MPSVSFATFLIICPTSFFLGILFSLFPYDYPLLWSSLPTAASHFDAIETHLKLLHNAPNLIVRILHIMLGMGLLGLIIKLYKPSESNMLFDGGSLVLYMVAVIVYIANIVKGLRIVSEGSYGLGSEQLTQDQLDDVNARGYDPNAGDSVLGREDNLKVLAASNTILALVLVGVLVLQVGQWYADRTDENALKAFQEKEKAEQEKKELEGSSPLVKRSSSGKEGKKTK
ncbi:ER membrane protein SH3 [Cladophialophora yegresii CBS 114405]|uniref:ER membrane protein SH3 n=1 Tax=Cladophialophora yegresii CBS 114405 TaxID=1182544 RepID=W9WKE1_9EURO|nr:ER membrane protein SH3 [Cladophialophora yegresii CBS 114405]EXJ65460.1 ER membrane protein SH3 [Cladophialophora yegresii CBS 114405]